MPRFNITCRECSYTDDHAEWCQSRGYAAVGPHPDAPQPETQRAPAAPVECPCGGIRGVCEYHPLVQARTGAAFPGVDLDDVTLWRVAGLGYQPVKMPLTDHAFECGGEPSVQDADGYWVWPLGYDGAE